MRCLTGSKRCSYLELVKIIHTRSQLLDLQFAPALHTMNLENILPRRSRSNSVLEGTNSTEGEEKVTLSNIHVRSPARPLFHM